MMGCYGIGVGRLLAAAIEQNHDDKGMALPAPIAPYQVHLVGLNLKDAETARRADELYTFLWGEGFDVLFDDRPDESAGVKFNDADLLGMPVRLVISNRSLKNESLEFKRRLDVVAKQVAMKEIVPVLREALAA
jgi:prolyl-tRNA synthetase